MWKCLAAEGRYGKSDRGNGGSGRAYCAGVSIDDCEAVSRPLSDALDEADPIEGSYTLEVSSAGADRPLRRPEHFNAFLGSEVEVRLYRPAEGRKDHVGILRAYRDGDVTIESGGTERCFPKKDVAQVRLYVRF